MEKQINKISKYLSFILRHKPETIGLTLDVNGWAEIDQLIANTTDFQLSHHLINVVVETNDKQRFIINHQNGKIRANQGHSIDVDLNLKPSLPPQTLFHGTTEQYYKNIKIEGLNKQKRHHVHLSEDMSVAISVGSRYGKIVLLEVDTQKMSDEGFVFYKTANNVWLVDEIPTQYLTKKEWVNS